VEEDTTYYYEVRSCAGCQGCDILSEPSNQVSITIQVGSQPTDEIANVSGIAMTDTDINEVVTYSIQISWDKYDNASRYEIYRSINNSENFEKKFDRTWQNWVADYDIDIFNSYSYYIIAYNNMDEQITNSSKIVTIDTWLPPCWQISPENNSSINNANFYFHIQPVNISNLPYGPILYAFTEIVVWDEDPEISNAVGYGFTEEDDLTLSQLPFVQYNPMFTNHLYGWSVTTYGFDVTYNDLNPDPFGFWDDLVAVSGSNYKYYFTYTGPDISP